MIPWLVLKFTMTVSDYLHGWVNLKSLKMCRGVSSLAHGWHLTKMKPLKVYISKKSHFAKDFQRNSSCSRNIKGFSVQSTVTWGTYHYLILKTDELVLFGGLWIKYVHVEMSQCLLHILWTNIVKTVCICKYDSVNSPVISQ